jgi:hypothetical protein
MKAISDRNLFRIMELETSKDFRFGEVKCATDFGWRGC